MKMWNKEDMFAVNFDLLVNYILNIPNPVLLQMQVHTWLAPGPSSLAELILIVFLVIIKKQNVKVFAP